MELFLNRLFGACRYNHDNSDAGVDGFDLSVYDRVNKLSKHIPVRLSTLLDRPATVKLVEGGRTVLLMENLIAGYSGKPDVTTSYAFDVVVAATDIAVVVGGKQLQSFTARQVRLQLQLQLFAVFPNPYV